MEKIAGMTLIAALLLVPAALPGQVSATAQRVDSVNSTAAMAAQPADTSAVALRSCVSSYTGQTVSGSVTVDGCNTLAIRNVTVNNGGTLSVAISGIMTVGGPFEVKLGGAFNAGLAEPEEDLPSVFGYTYDNAGNRTSRTYGRMTTVRTAVAPSGKKQEKDTPISKK